MSEDVLVKVEGVSKKFCRSLKHSLWYGVTDVTSELLGQKRRNEALRNNEFWAVNDITFELKRGECLGLIGPNGAGKSTLLKMLNGLIKPDKGRISIKGRVGALIELGAGFNPILTVRENIYVNGSVLGLTQKQIDRKFDDIVEFSELESTIETPVQSLSSGMKVRLGFAIASQLEPDVLLVDEVLAVGDANFSFKCINQISKISRDCCVVVVSHSMPMIARMSSLALSMDRGRMTYFGEDVGRAIENYLSKVELSQEDLSQSDYLELVSVNFSNSSRRDSSGVYELSFGQPIQLELSFRLKKPIPECYANLVFMDMEGKPVAQCMSSSSGVRFVSNMDRLGINLELDSLLLNNGRYYLHLGIVEALPARQLGEILYQNRFLAPLSVVDGVMSWAPVQFVGNWISENS